MLNWFDSKLTLQLNKLADVCLLQFLNELAYYNINWLILQQTSIEHTKMWRDKVLFIRQRQQATSDYRENKNIRWLGKKSFLIHPCTSALFQLIQNVDLVTRAFVTCVSIRLKCICSCDKELRDMRSTTCGTNLRARAPEVFEFFLT